MNHTYILRSENELVFTARNYTRTIDEYGTIGSIISPGTASPRPMDSLLQRRETTSVIKF